MNKTTELLCAHSAWVFAALMGIGLFGIAGWLPPLDPAWPAQKIAQIFQDHVARIRAGVAVLAFCSVFFWPFAVAITTQMRRMEGRYHPMASVQLASATGTVIAILLASFLWLAAAYRPDAAPPATLQFANDLAWMCFVGLYPPAVIQCGAIGLCILADTGGGKVYPRWLGYANFWVAIGFLPGAAVPFFHRGPFAWNGLLAFWLVAVLFFAWIILMWWATVGAIRRAEAEEGA